MYVGARQVVPTHSVNTQVSTYSKDPFYPAIAATLASFALLIFLLRVYTRIRLLRFFAIDDWLLLGAVVGLIIALASVTPVRRSDGREGQGNTLRSDQALGLHIWICALSSTACVTLIKTSIACFLLRTVKRTVYRRVLYILAATVASTGLAWFVTILCECIPITATWDAVGREKARCMSRIALMNVMVFYNTIDAASNLIFALLSMPIFWSSHLTIRNKLFLIPRIIILVLGFLSTAAAIIRLTNLYALRNASSTTTVAADQPTSHAAAICIWSVVEMTVGIIAACLPTLKPLLATVSAFFSNLSPTRRSSSAKSSNQHHEDSPPPSPYPQSYSTPTFLSLPRPKPTRFHDHTSDLDFDLFEGPGTTRSRAHSRTPSNFTVFTTFTNFTSTFTVPPFDRELEAARPRAYSKAMSEMEKPVELDAGGKKGGYAVSVTSGCGSGEACDGSEEEKTIRRMGSDESCGAVGGGIMRTTEVRVS